MIGRLARTLLIVGLFCAAAYFAEQSRASDAEAIRKAKIRTITSWLDPDAAGTDNNTRKEYFRSFDRQGNEVELIAYDRFDGKVISRDTNTYDNSGRVVERTSSDALHATDGTWSYRYDQKGCPLSGDFRKPDGTFESRWAFDCDDRGRVILEILSTPPTQVLIKKRHSFDDHSRLIETIEENSDGAVTSREVYHYNDRGNVQESLVYRDNGLISRTTYRYNKKQFLVEKRQYDSDGSLGSTNAFGYNGAGLIVEEDWVIEAKPANGMSGVRERKKYVYEFYQ